MLWRILAIVALGAISQGAERVGPSGFYIVSRSLSHIGPSLYYRVVDVRAEGAGTTVRYYRIAPASQYCSRRIVQAAESRIAGKSPAQLVGSNSPCAIGQAKLRAAIRRFPARGALSEAASFGIVAECGPGRVLLALPPREGIDIEKMKAFEPAMVRLWDLGREVTRSAFGPDDVFQNRSDEDEMALQRSGGNLVPELISGRFDEGLAASERDNQLTRKSSGFQSLLADYKGPISQAEVNAALVPRLLHAAEFRFHRFVAPEYPRLAMLARVQGEVQFLLTVAPATGEVVAAAAVSGHPMLKRSAMEAIQQWRFAADPVTSKTVEVTIEYALRCQ